MEDTKKILKWRIQRNLRELKYWFEGFWYGTICGGPDIGYYDREWDKLPKDIIGFSMLIHSGCLFGSKVIETFRNQYPDYFDTNGGFIMDEVLKERIIAARKKDSWRFRIYCWITGRDKV